MGGRVGARNEMQACLMQILQRDAEMPGQVTPEGIIQRGGSGDVDSLVVDKYKPLPNFLLPLNFLIT